MLYAGLHAKNFNTGRCLPNFPDFFLRIETFFFYISLLLLLLLLLLSLFLSLSFSASVVFLQSHLVPAAAAVVQKKNTVLHMCMRGGSSNAKAKGWLAGGKRERRGEDRGGGGWGDKEITLGSWK